MNGLQPDGWRTVTPRIITANPDELVRLVKDVFRGQGEFHVNRPAETRIGDSMIMISDGGGLREPVSAFLYVNVENVDKTYQRAIEAGAQSLEIPLVLPYGDGRAMVKDLWGNAWPDCFAQAWHLSNGFFVDESCPSASLCSAVRGERSVNPTQSK